MEFVKSKNQYTDAILFDDETDENDLLNFLVLNCVSDVQLLGTVENEYHPDGVDVPYLNGMNLPVAKIACFYVCGKKREIISVPRGYYLNWNGRAIKVTSARDFEKEWSKIDDLKSDQTTFEDNEEA